MPLSLTGPDVIGYVGVAMILVAYGLVQFEKLNPAELIYPILNTCGAAAVLVSLYFSPNWPSIVIEVAWLTIGVSGLIRWALKARKH